jgi:hypothetical protein
LSFAQSRSCWVRVAALAAVAIALVAVLAAAARPARAAWFPGTVVDGPSSDIVEVDGLDLSLDGTGGVVYIKRDGGVPHVFVSQFYQGNFGPPQRVDPGLTGPSSSARIAASEDGRLAVVFLNGGSLYSAVSADKTKPFTQPALVAQGAPGAQIINPSLDMSVHGAAYVAYVATPAGGGGGDVNVARLPDDGLTFSQIPGPLDLDGGRQAGTGAGRPSIAVAADGTAICAWGEAGGVLLRRISRDSLSSGFIGASDSPLDGHAPGQADSPDVSLEDDSSYGEVVLRQNFDNGNGFPVSRLIGRHLVASDLGAAEAIDGLDFPAPEGAMNPQLGMDMRGRGLASGSRQQSLTPTNALLRDDSFAPGSVLGSLNNGGTDPQTVTAAGQNLTGVVAWMQAPTPAPNGIVVAGRFEVSNTYEDEVQLSPGAFGPVPADGGLFAASSRVGDSLVAFSQGPPSDRRVVASIYARFPGRAIPRTPNVVHSKQPLLRWLPATSLFGLPTYQVVVDGRLIGETQATSLRPPNPLSEGRHSWRVNVIDAHGQKRPGRSRALRVKTTPTPA